MFIILRTPNMTSNSIMFSLLVDQAKQKMQLHINILMVLATLAL
jgi:hypothetical protein